MSEKHTHKIYYPLVLYTHHIFQAILTCAIGVSCGIGSRIYKTIGLHVMKHASWNMLFTRFRHYHLGYSRLGYYFWDKRLNDYVIVDLGVYHDLLLFDG
jgi:hypothetical protein